MATVTGLGVFYFLMQWLVVIVKYLSLSGKKRATGVVTSVSDNGSECEYEVSINGERHIIKRKKGNDGPGYKESDVVECIYKKENELLLPSDYEQLKKGLYMMPVYSVICAIVTVVLIYIGASI